MSVLVKGMDMPISCAKCPLSISECSAVMERVKTSEPKIIEWIPWSYRHEDCPLVEVPTPHGRLIDADWFAAEMKKRQEEAGKWLREAKDRETAVRADAVLSFLCEVKLTLDAAPTIIPADEGET